MTGPLGPLVTDKAEHVINLGPAPAEGRAVTVKIEPAEKAWDGRVRLVKDFIFFLFSIGVALVFLWICYQTLMSPAASPEEKKWAMSGLTALAGGLVGYWAKK